MNDMLLLPPSRPIPAESHARIRAELVRAATDAQAGSIPGRRSRGRRPQRRWWLVGVAAVVVAGVGAAAGAGLIGPAASHAPATASGGGQGSAPRSGAETPVRTLLAYTHTVHAVRAADLPPGAARGLALMEARIGGTPTNVQEPIAGPPSIYLVHLVSSKLGPDVLCLFVVIDDRGPGFCNVALRTAEGSLSVTRVGFDGRGYVVGLAANDVRSISVSLASTATTPGITAQAEIVDNVFLAPLGGIDAGGALTVTATRTDGTTSTVTRPALPAPPTVTTPQTVAGAGTASTPAEGTTTTDPG